MKTLLGEGTYGRVYRELYNEKEVAVKYIKSNKLGLRELGEINTLLKFFHPNLMRADKIIFTREHISIIMPIGVINIDENIKPKWIHGLISGLSFMHKNGYIHGDIKHDNILIINDEAVLSDFSISTRFFTLLKDTQTPYCKNPQQHYQLTPHLFKNPEPVMLKPYTFMQSDIWALGCTIFCIVNMEYPFQGKKLAQKLEKYVKSGNLHGKPDFKDVIKTLMNPDPDALNIDFLKILSLPSFQNRYSELNDGVFISTVNNVYPIVFTDSIKSRFKKLFLYLFSISDAYEIPIEIIYNTIDMFYRIFTIFLRGADKKQILIYISVCLIISCKVYDFIKVDYNDIEGIAGVDKETFLDIEIEIVDFLGGVLDRDITNIRKDFRQWIIENTEKFQ